MNNELTNDIPLDFNLPKDKTENIIKVIGVGGGGGNASRPLTFKLFVSTHHVCSLPFWGVRGGYPNFIIHFSF